MFSNFAVDHVGIAVSNLEDSIGYYQSTFGFSLIHRETLIDRGIELAFLSTGNTKLELLMGIGTDDAISKFIAKRGEGLHHICYIVGDINMELNKLKALGLNLIDQQARPGAMNTMVAFIHPKSCGGVLTELCQEIA